MSKRNKDVETVSQEDIEAKAYFDPPDGAGSWLEIGRRRLRYQIGKYVDFIFEESNHRFKFTFPLSTEDTFLMLGGLGYSATRRNFDYFVRHGHMELPKKAEGRLAWDIENVIDFGMQLEKMRYWLPGRHVEKKTVWELQAESDNVLLGVKVANDAEFQTLDADDVLDRIAATKDRKTRAAMGGYYPIRLFERGIRMDEVAQALLSQLVDEDDAAQRKALVKAIQKHFENKATEE